MKKIIYNFLWLGIFLFSFVIHAQDTKPIIQSRLEGKVIDQITNEPIIGASIVIKGTTHGVSTDLDGKFYFQTGQKFPYILIVSYIGYKKKEVQVDGSPVFIKLSQDVKELNDVVIVGYGTQKRQNLIGSVSKVNPEELRVIPDVSFDAKLQGKAAGVQVNTNTGVPGSDVFIRVRGATSINAGNDPLYVVDGVFINNASLQNIAQDRATSPLADINPSDIESIEILKDASAIAIYGSRGANGVIIVTTKRGTFEQKTRIEFNTSGGFAWAPKDKIWETTTGPEHALLVNEYNKNMGTAQPFRPASVVINGVPGRGLPENQPTYDRMAYLNQTAELRNYDLAVQGGSNTTRFYLGGGYTFQESIWKPMSFDRASFKFNIDHKINNSVSFSVSNTFSKSERDQARPANGGNGTLLQASLNIPTYLPIFAQDGTPLKWVNFDNIDVLTSTVNLWSTSYHYIGNAYLDVNFTKKLKFRSSFGLDYNLYDENEYWDTRTILGAAGGRGSESVTQSTTAINEQTLNYNTAFGDHNLGILIGNTIQNVELKNVSATGTNFPNNSYTQISSAATQTASQFTTNSGLLSFFSRVNYNYNRKYYLEATIRADGSSRFGENNKWGYFPAIGAAWRIKEESFLKDVSQISNLKYKISYGLTGNQTGIADFASQGLWNGGYGYSDKVGSSEGPGTAPLQIANPDLKWEKTAQFSTGLELGLFSDRINLEFNYYQKYTSDVLLQIATPATTGFSSYLTNYGEISNKGFELGINTVNIQNKNFTWKTDFNISQNINKIEKIPADIPFAGRDLIRLQQGKPLYSYWLYKQLYVDPQTGDAVFEDYNKDGKITADDRQIVGNTWPKFFGGFNNTFQYKNFDLGVFFTYSYGNEIWNHNRMLGETGGTLDANRVLLASQLDRWTTPGQITDTPRLTADNYSRQENSRFLEDGSFIRLRALTVGYTLPKEVSNKLRIQKFRLYFTGSNLLMFTKYTGSDPESNLGTGNIQGYDYGTPPQPRTVQLGLNLTF
ncbi:SusC/RagA family TonB-linked outer membrane protein [Flavobacterium sp. WC2509]|uniref:SusC/RagA family TonB-linked outer membrane protein n=1 Tax=Flavobacterium sp. WC2509 TaxID=3461406 RepID=UPI0040440B9A